MSTKTIKTTRKSLAACAAALVLALGGCSRDDAGDYGSDAAGLAAYVGDIRAAMRSGDHPKAVALARALLPDERTLAHALEDGADDAKEKLITWYAAQIPQADAGVLRMFDVDPKHTEVVAHGATTEEIAVSRPGTVAYKEFPGGAREAAQTILRPGLVFYEVELIEAGKDTGVKYHLFVHTGAEWKMLGPIWRAPVQPS